MDNDRIWEFRKKLEAAGLSLSLALWSTKTNPDARYDDLAIYAVSGFEGGGGTIIIQDYGENGFGVWFESQSIQMDDDVLELVRRANRENQA